MNPSKEHREQWQKTLNNLYYDLNCEKNKPKEEQDLMSIEFYEERIKYVKGLLNPPRNDNNPAIG